MTGIDRFKTTLSNAVRVSSFSEALEKLIYLAAGVLGFGFVVFVLIMMMTLMGFKLFLVFISTFVVLAVAKGAFVLFLK